MTDQRIKKILVPLDGSRNSMRGLNKAIYLAKEHEATLTFLHVVHHLPKKEGKIAPEKEISQDEPTFLLTAKMLAKKNGISSSSRVLTGDPGHVLVDYSHTHHVDLIVIGSRGLGTFKKVFLGSVSSYVMQKANTAVMVIK
ncbi:MAG: universal stress protein [Thaumarchaeota archaeon]|nr:universal stress protein [Nitrososphaerota archaeon]